MSRSPAISVVIPAYNAEGVLRRAVRSLQRQTFRDWEAVIVDDGSADGTRALVETLAAREPRLQALHRANGGAGAARNTGLAAARGEQVLFLDADDELTPRALARLHAALAADPGCTVAGGRCVRVSKDGRRWPLPVRDLSDAFGVLCAEGGFAIHSFLVRADAVRAAGGFDEGLQTSEDWDLWQRIARTGARFRQIDAVTAVYHAQDGSLSRRIEQAARDALTVMARGHGPDPRVQAAPGLVQGGPADALESRRLHFILWSAARAVALGSDPGPVLDLLDGTPGCEVNAEAAGELMAAGLAEALGKRPADLREGWSAYEPALAAVLARVFPEADRARTRALILATIQARLGAREPAALRIEGRGLQVDVKGGAGYAVGLVQGRGGTLGLAALPEGADSAEVARRVAARAERLPLGPALAAARPWTDARFWTAAGRVLADPRGLGLGAQLSGPDLARLKPVIRARVRRAAAAGLAAHVAGRLPVSGASPASAAAAEGSTEAERGRAPAQVRDAGAWEDFFDAEDPWRYEDSAYEQRKYEDTLELIPDAPDAEALELACAEGVFTRRLAERVGRLTASDISAKALERAAARCADVGDVAFLRLDFMQAPIPGRYDLIVCSEVLYYAGAGLPAVARRIAGALKPGGLLVSAHANAIADGPDETGFDWGNDYGAKTIVAAFEAAEGLHLEREIRRPLYRVAAFRKGERRSPARREDRPLDVALDPPIARSVVWGGGESRIGALKREVTIACPILMYHRVAPEGPEALRRYRVDPEMFEQQLSLLRRRGFWGLRPADLAAALQTQRPFPGRPVMITFDDGYEDFAQHAWPSLQRHDFPATVFAVSERLGGVADWDAHLGPPARLLEPEAIRALAGEGVAFESHGATHRSFARLEPGELRREAVQSRERLAEITGRPPIAFCYPYGAHDLIAEQAVAEAGYALGFTAAPATASISSDPLRLPRVEVSGFDTLETFARKLGLAL